MVHPESLLKIPLTVGRAYDTFCKTLLTVDEKSLHNLISPFLFETGTMNVAYLKNCTLSIILDVPGDSTPSPHFPSMKMELLWLKKRMGFHLEL